MNLRSRRVKRCYNSQDVASREDELIHACFTKLGFHFSRTTRKTDPLDPRISEKLRRFDGFLGVDFVRRAQADPLRARCAEPVQSGPDDLGGGGGRRVAPGLETARLEEVFREGGAGREGG